MLRFEMRKIFSKAMGKMTLGILLAALAVVSWLAVSGVVFVDADGESHTGTGAVRQLRALKTEWAGMLDIGQLQRVLAENGRINRTPEALSRDYREADKAYARKQGFSDILALMNCAFSPFREYDAYRVDSVSAEAAGDFYENRIANLRKWLDTEAKELYTDTQKSYLTAQYEKLETPLYYTYQDGWEAVTEYAPTMIMLILLTLAFPVSGIFSNEFTLKADSIFFSAKCGRNKAVRSKLEAGLLLTTMVYWGVMLVYSAIVLGILGTDGANCMIQTGLGGWKSFYHLTFAQLYAVTLLGGYLGNLVILTLSMLVSAKTHSTVVAVTIPFIMIFLDSFLGGIHALSKVLGLMPDQLLQMNMAVKYFNVYQIGTTVTGAVPVLFCLYSVLFVCQCPLVIRVYRKTQIK